MTLIKEKRIKFGKRKAITFSDKSIGDIGDRLTYSIKDSKITIHRGGTELDRATTISRKKSGNQYIPLLDLRNADVRKWLESAKKESGQLHIAIFEDEIVVKHSDSPSVSPAPASNVSSKGLKAYATSKIVSIQSHIRKAAHKLRNRIVAQSQQKSNVSGGSYEQITLDLFDNSSIFDSLSSSERQQVRDDLPLVLEITEAFCGAGLLSQGFEQVGYEIDFAFDLNEEAIETYQSNYSHPSSSLDIREFNKNMVADTPVIVGGPPCQGFSNANRHTGFLDNPNNFLVREFIQMIKNNRNCKVFVMENVPQLLTAGDGAFTDEILSELSDFEISYGVLNSADYGTPQTRKRAIFIGSKIGKIELPAPLLSPDKYMTVAEAFIGLTDNIPNQLDITKSKDDTALRMSFVGQGENWRSIPDNLKNKKMLSGSTHSSVYRRLHNDFPSPTIVNPRKSLITHPTKNRILSVRECARLFDLPDNFIFKGALSAMQQQICNGVPVKLGKAIADKVRVAMEQFNIRHFGRLI